MVAVSRGVLEAATETPMASRAPASVGKGGVANGGGGGGVSGKGGGASLADNVKASGRGLSSFSLMQVGSFGEAGRGGEEEYRVSRCAVC